MCILIRVYVCRYIIYTYPSICIHNDYICTLILYSLNFLYLFRPPSRLWQSPRPADRKATFGAANGPPYTGCRSLRESWRNHWKPIEITFNNRKQMEHLQQSME